MQPVGRGWCAASGQANLRLGPPGQCVVLPVGMLLRPVSSAASRLADLGLRTAGTWVARPICCAANGQACLSLCYQWAGCKKLGFLGMMCLRVAMIVWAMHEGSMLKGVGSSVIWVVEQPTELAQATGWSYMWAAGTALKGTRP